MIPKNSNFFEFLTNKECTQTKLCQQNNWTLIYDEGIGLKLNGFDFLTYFEWKALKSHDDHKIKNVNCGKTLVGWLNSIYSNEEQTACFIMEKLENHVIKIVKNENTLEKHVIKRKSLLTKIDNKLKMISEVETNNFNKLKINEVSKDLIKRIPAKLLDSNYKLKLANENYLTPWERYIKKNKSHYNKNCNDQGFPCNVNWKEFIPETQNQGPVGDCYMYSTRHMLMARSRIYFPKRSEGVDLTVDHLLKCAYPTQGKDGGFSYEVNNFLRYNPGMSQICWKEANGDCLHKCSKRKSLLKMRKGKYSSKHAYNIKVSDYGYVGDFYGNSSENAMIKELQNGPIVINYQADPFDYQSLMKSDFKHNTVYTPDASWTKNYDSKKNMKDGWERVGHSNLIYGYGKDKNGKKFWRVQNSWGKIWANQGYVKVIRGIDSMGIESNAEWANPI